MVGGCIETYNHAFVSCTSLLNPKAYSLFFFFQRQEHHPRRPRMLPADDRNEPEDEVESHYWESLEVSPQR